MKLNHKVKAVKEDTVFTTHGGAEAAEIDSYHMLRRSVMSCLLWENEFYESGEKIADRIVRLVGLVEPEKVASLATEARNEFHLRHIPLLLVCAMVKNNYRGKVVEDAIYNVIRRADELAEIFAILAKVNNTTPDKIKKHIPHVMKRGVARAFRKFDEYSLQKYNSDGAVKLRDVLFMVHAKAENPEQDALWKRLINNELATPETWEVMLSKGDNKKETFEYLIKEGKLGYIALLRNLRNCIQADCDFDLVKKAILDRKNGADKVLPFRYVAAARAAPRFENELDQAMISNLQQVKKLKGKTILVIDISGSMDASLSSRSDMTRLDTACALGAVAREVCEDVIIFATAGSDARRVHATMEVPNRHGMALVDGIKNMRRELGCGGIFLKQVCDYLQNNNVVGDRMIVITDEQDCGDRFKDSPLGAIPLGDKHNYMINVASNRNGIGYGDKWTHIDGFSENVIRYIQESENFG